MTQDMSNKIMTREITQSYRLSLHDCGVLSMRVWHCAAIRCVILLLLMVVGVNTAWAQSLPSVTTSSNTYLYQFNLGKNNAPEGRSTFYMTPSSPKVSIKESPGNNEVWYVIETDDTPLGTFERDHIAHYCYIVNAVSGEYLYYTGTNSNSIETNVVEMKAIDAIGAETDRFKFIIKKSGNGTYYNLWFFPKIAAENNPTRYESNSAGFLALGIPQGSTYANGITLSKEKNGVWTSQWFINSVSLFDAPTITFNSETNQFTISHNVLSSGCTIYYTTDNSTPSSSWTPYTGAVDVSASATVRSVVIRDDIVLTEVGSLAVSPAIEAPVVTNNYDGTITLNCATTGALIYYTLDGTTPSSSNGTLYTSAFSLGNATVIKAIAYNSAGTLSSEVTTYNVPQYDAPTIGFNSGTSKVTITSEGTAYYNTGDGSQADPTTSSTEYSAPFTVSSATTVKAIATHAGYIPSEVTTLAITQVATPTIQNNGSNAISITSDTPGATIYYTTDGSTPTTSSNLYSTPLQENVSGVTIKAIAVKENMIPSAVGSGAVTLQCEEPVIVRSGNDGFTVTCPFPASGVTIYYTTDGSTPTTSSSSTTSGNTVSCVLPATIKAFAVATNYDNSTEASVYLTLGMSGDGSAVAPYTIEYQSDVADFITKANTAAEASKHYKVIATGSLDFSGTAAITQSFSGTFDGGLCVLTGLTHPLFNTVNGGTVKNVILKGVNIISGDSDGDAGAICNKALGATRIYNCGILPTATTRDDDGNITGFTGSSVSGSRYVGGLVGFLDGTSRVINCFSYANISGGSVRAGIVGYNNYASKYNDLKTMVMNCMFYGDINVVSDLYPIYGGSEISNDYSSNSSYRLNNYNYFLYEAPYSEGRHIDGSHYNCALAAEERFLVRFEFYRHLLNSTRELAAWYATGDAANGRGKGNDNKMAKWVLDKSIAPYPILKPQDTYPSVVNYDPVYTFVPEYDSDTGNEIKKERTTVTKRNQGKDLGTTLTISIQNSTSGGQSAPAGANVQTSSLSRPRIDKDTLNYNFNYDKVQLPYYNDVGTGNYTGNRVVTGWKIVSMSGGTSGGYSEANYDFPNYNYADRDTYGKDIYTSGTGNSGRVFSQGAYFNVPKGVTEITIEPYWGIAAYLSDANYDRYGYNNNDDLTQVGDGPRYTNDTDCPVLTGNQKVFTSISNALEALTGALGTATVYDYAIVLVGNYHHHATEGRNGLELSSDTKPFTIMSIDLNEDNEPDYCLIYRSGKNQPIAPIRFDFITVPGIAMAHKMASNGDLGIPGNCKPNGWFEITTTGLIKYGQFEHSYDSKTLSPLIFLGGVIDQFVSNNTGDGEKYTNKTKYMLFGDNVWFNLLSNGTHMDKTSPTPHRPISLVGGEYGTLYLSGYFRPDATICNTLGGDNNAECYIDGGKFGEIAGAGQENIDGNVTWKIDHADIRKFYGGGQKVVKEDSQITGNISTTIKNSYVDIFCGGPKFGDMAAEKTVTTTANDCTFGTYFGAGYGGTSILKEQFYNVFQKLNYNEWNTKVNGTYKEGTRGKYTEGKGVAVNYEYEFFAGAAGNVHRLYLWYASFSLAQTNNVTSELTGCTVNNNFYGGGSLGAVSGDATSTLTDCTILGNVFGAGYSVHIPTVDVRPLRANPYEPEPKYNTSTGVYEEGIPPANVSFTWSHATVANGSSALDESDPDNLIIKTNESLEGLGAVTGNVILTLKGSTVVGTAGDNTTGNVYGGGDESAVKGSTHTVTVNLQDNTTVNGDVFGGGNMGLVEGNAKVNIMVPEE